MKNNDPYFPPGVAVVIGGSGGIGQQICRCLAEHGTDVAFTYRNNKDAATQAQSMIEAAGQGAFGYALDITDRDAVNAFFSEIANRYSRIHSVIAATGASFRLAYAAQINYDEWDDTILGDLTGFFNVCKAAIPHLRLAQGGSLVALTSAALVRHSPKDILSTAPKAGIEALLRAIAREEGRFGVRANSVAVGAIDGGLMNTVWGQVSSEFADAIRNNIPLKRMGLPTDISDVAVFLASSRSSFITGQRIVVDGGYSV
jgi:NAD(P)-dependent dehydrogenase (short-subunit alcohol dehydrogenase family)